MSFKEDFQKVITYSQDIPEPKVDDLILRWKEAKADFLHFFNGEMIYEFPETITFELDESEKRKRIGAFEDMITWQYPNPELVKFIESMSDGFYNNMTPEDYICADGTKIQKGTKLVKAFKFFEKDKYVLDLLQSKASQIIQEDKVSGKLCFSVHPLDFLSLSENAHNWRSCHALDGDYCGGNLSYMLDRSTFICYLKSPYDQQISNFPEDVKWNSKKWRVLLYASDDWSMIAAGRQYPFTSTIGLEVVREKLKEVIFPLSGYSSWTPTVNKFVGANEEKIWLEYPHIIVGGGIKPKRDVIIDKSDLHYNDLLKSSCYEPLFLYRRNNYWSGSRYYGISSLATTITVGGVPKCLRCESNDITSTVTMMCNSCEEEYGSEENENFAYCASCGRRTHVDRTHWINDDELVCDECLENLHRCECCGQYFYEDDIYYNRDGGYYECYNCKHMEEY